MRFKIALLDSESNVMITRLCYQAYIYIYIHTHILRRQLLDWHKRKGRGTV